MTTSEFKLIGQIAKLTERIVELEAENARQKEALELIADWGSSVRRAMYISNNGYPISSRYQSGTLQALKDFRAIASIGLDRKWPQEYKEPTADDEYDDAVFTPYTPRNHAGENEVE